MKYLYTILFTFIFILFALPIFGQGDICVESEPFSTSTSATFPAGVDSGNGEPGPNYGCLNGDQPNPAWYYLRISVSGDIRIRLSSAPSEDIDFILWGPFSDPHAPCVDELTGSAIVDCSWSASSVEECYLPNGIIGEYYILLITNWSNNPCIITAEKIAGTGETDETIINTEATNNGPLCVGETLELYAEAVEDGTYAWEGPDGFESSQQNPVIENVQMSDAGMYRLIVTVNDVTSPAFQTNVIVKEGMDFEITDMDNNVQDTFNVCFGDSIRLKAFPFPFLGSVEWDDGQSGQYSSYIDESGEISAINENFFGCHVEKTVFVNVYDKFNVNLNIDDFCETSNPILLNSQATPGGGVFSGNPVFLSGGNYFIDPDLIPLNGSDTIFYTYVDDNECENLTYNIPTHFANPEVSLNPTNLSEHVCIDATPITIDGGDPIGGEYIGEAVNAGSFDPSITGIGITQIKYGYTDTQGCTDTASMDVEVVDLPIVGFDAIPQVCQNTGTVIIDQAYPTENGVGVYSGDYITSDGIFNTNNTPIGEYEITYEFTDEYGCSNFAQQTIFVILGPQPPEDVSVNNDAYCSNAIPETITLSCVGDDEVYYWYENDYSTDPIGDQKTITIPAPNVTTTYLVRSEGNCYNSSDLSVVVNVYDPPVSTFSIDNVCEGENIAITNGSSSPTDPIVTWDWDFGNGSTSNLPNPEYSFPEDGTYNVSLRVITDNSCSDISEQELSIFANPQAPTSISVSTNNYCSAEKPATITLNCTGLDPEINYYWYRNNTEGSPIGNGKSLEVPAPTITKTYYVRSETENCGNSTDKNIEVVVYPSPVASFSIEDACLGTTISPTETSTNGNIVNWSWDFGDGSGSSQQSPQHNYSNYGDYNVNLVVSTDFGCSDTEEQQVSIYDNPVALFSVEDNCHEQTSSFSNLSSAPVSNITSYTWNMDGTILTTENPNYTFSNPGQYTVSLEVSTPQGCTDQYQDVIEIFPLPSVGFTYNNPCRSNVVELSNTSSAVGAGNNLESFLWDFNNGETSDQRDLTYIYPSDGTYQISLKATDSRGCEDIFVETNVIVSPDFDVSIANNDFCIGVSGVLDGGPVPVNLPMDSYEWLLPNGTTVTGEDANYTFSAAGDYEVSLIGQLGECTAGRTSTINVKELPEAAFNITGYCVNSPTTFTDQSSGDGLSIDHRSWNLGNGEQYEDLLSLTTTYTSTGNYPISLEVTDSRGCKKTTTESLLLNPLPLAVFSPQLPYCVGDEIQFNNQSYSAGGFSGFQWNMGDGTIYTDFNATHTFSGSGDQYVQLIAIDEWLCRDTSYKTVFVTPDFDIDFSTSGLCNGLPAQLSGEVVSATITPDSWSWIFDDGGSATGQSVSYSFAESGPHNVQLTAKKNGCPEVLSREVNVNPCPTADFIYSLVSLDDTVQFQDASTLNGGPAIVSWSWDFGDPMSGLQNYSTQQNPEHLFSHLGDFDVELTVTDLNGCYNTIIKTLTVNPRPVAGFEWDLSCFGEEVQFTDTSSTNQGFITDWWWNFGDPASGAFNQSTAQNPSHAFTAPGTYDVQLVVKAYGYDTITNQVVVHSGPSAQFDFNTPCQGEIATFQDLSTEGDAPIIEWFWDFADGTSSTQQNPQHTYALSGNYLVDLTVTDENGCSNTITQNVTVWQGVIAKFSYYSACVGNLTYFVDKSIIDGLEVVSWDWSFGDPASGIDNYSTEQNPSHQYTTEGTYEVILIVEDANGCTDSDTLNILIEPAPVADFTAESVCMGETMTFIDQSYSNGQPIISWYWEFGDGSTSTIANPTHTYQQAGTYDVLLIVETDGGCTQEIVKSVDVFYLPTSDFTWENTYSCENDTIQFIDLSYSTGNGLIDSWYWQFGDGNSSSDQNPEHYYAQAGVYTVSLLVTDINGCEHSSQQDIVVSMLPISNFTFENPDCDSVAFTSTGYDPNGLAITSWYWNFDDPASGTNNTSTAQNPYHQYNIGGSYQVTHIVTNENGCSDTTIQEVVISKPQAYFSFTTNCAGLPLNFTDESTTTGDPIVSWLWNFNDGSTSTQQNPSHIFVSGGSYLVSLKVTTAGGCESQTAHVVEVNYGPTPNFIYTSIHCTGDSIQFTDVSTGNAPIVSWEWQFGDGNTSDLQNPRHAYANAGSFLVNLRVTDENGCYQDKTVTLTIDQSPTANFNWDVENCDTTFFTDFTNTNGTQLIAWTWEFDDPASGTENISFVQNPSHKFTAAGNYQVQLTVSNQHLCSDTVSKIVSYDTQPGADFTFDTVCFGDFTQFTDLTPTDFQTIQGWEWQFGDGTTSVLQNPSHQYTAPGSYEVTLRVINTNFCEDSITKTVLVRELPIVAFSPDSSCFNEPVNFVDETIYNGIASEWLWDFGDGSTSTEQNPVHNYATAGTYMVSLTVTEQSEGTAGCSNSFSQPYYVNPLPLVDFTFDSVCIGSVTQFNSQASSPVGIETYYWDFGDGTTSAAANPTHTYTSFENYQVKLIVTDFMGCMDSLEKTVNVYENPMAMFEASTVCLGDSTVFTDLTSPTASSWNWSFGDGTNSSLQNPKHLYSTAGSYTVLLEVETINGCSNSIVQEVEVYPLPIVDFSWNFAACAADTVFFEDLSQGIGTDVISWSWDFGDNSSSTEQNPKHVYAESNDTTYHVTLIVESGTGCVDSLTQVINITGAPLAAFIYGHTANNGPCVNNQFAFTDESVTQSGLIQEWYWDFGDGTTSNSQNPIHFFAVADTFTVSLTVVNTAGCDATTMQDIIVLPLPIVDFSFDSVCLGDTTHFNDSDFIELGATAEWNYTFGDGGSSDISNPNHWYISAGTYNVILQITDTNQCRNLVTHEVPVYDLPSVDFTFDTACLYLPTQYTDLSQMADHELAQWDWSFGDGNSDNNQNPSHIFGTSGTFTTALTVTDAWGCSSSYQKLVTVFEPPVAHFNYSDTSCTSGFISFADSSYHSEGFAVNSFFWTMDDYETEEQNPIYIFPEVEQTYPVSLIITDVRGCNDTSNQDVYIRPELEIGFTSDTVCFGQETMLIAYATKPADAQVSEWSWYFDDGSEELTTSNDTIYHTFLSDGNFRVELRGMQANTSCDAGTLNNVKVRKNPVADFSAAPAACADSTVFINQSISSESSIEQWRWYFGDGETAFINTPDDPDIKHLYPPYLNTFEASLAISDEYGCGDSIGQTIQRYPCIYVNFITDTSIYCQSKVVTFKDSSIVDEQSTMVSKYWNFGDGSEETTLPSQDLITHIYDNTGTYEITYIITFDVGGDPISDTARKTITVYPTPIAAISAENVCDQQEALLISNTNANNSIVHDWTWYFGDGTDTTIISNDVNNAVRHTYPQNGAYDLYLVAVTDLGCRDTAQMNFIVNPVPVIGFMADTTEICGPNTILFTDTSKMASGSISRRAWSFGDYTDAITSSDTISHEYLPENGDQNHYYTITLTATTDSACQATDSIPEMIAQYALPRPAFSVEPDSIAITELENILLTNESENAYYFEWLMSDSILYTDSYEPSIWEDIQDTGHYKLQLYAQTIDGCWDSIESDFKVYPVFRFFIPNAFSPNGNGVNEDFGPRGKYFDGKSYNLRIYNRWGQIVFETNNFYEQWDGRDQNTGEVQPIGVYAWSIEVKDLEGNNEKFTGTVTLIL